MATAEELVAAMDEDGVDVSVALGYGWCDLAVAREANDCLLDAASRFPRRIIAFCAVHPAWDDDALREIERCADAGARGIGELHPTSQGVDLASGASVEPIVQFAAARGLPIVVHAALNPSATPTPARAGRLRSSCSRLRCASLTLRGYSRTGEAVCPSTLSCRRCGRRLRMRTSTARRRRFSTTRKCSASRRKRQARSASCSARITRCCGPDVSSRRRGIRSTLAMRRRVLGGNAARLLGLADG